jgi:hypothetical protein
LGSGAQSDEDKQRLTNTDNVELESTFKQLPLNLRGDAVEPNMALRVNGRRGHGGHFCGLRIDASIPKSNGE